MTLCRLMDPQSRRLRCWPTVEACYSRTWSSYRMLPHRHDRAEIMYVLKGKCRVTLYTCRPDPRAGTLEVLDEQSHRLGVGEFIFIDAGVMHTLEVEESSYMVNAEFRIGPEEGAVMDLNALCRASEAMRWWMDSGAASLCGTDPDGALHAALETVVESFPRLREDERPLQDVRMGQLLLTCARALHAANTTAGALVYVRRAAQMLAERLDEQIRVDELAAEIGVSASYLQKLFRQAQGMTIIDYLNRLRVERSKLLLTRTDDAVVDVAIATGFNSRQHFTRVFTALVGQSPQQYRKAARDQEKRQLFYFN